MFGRSKAWPLFRCIRWIDVLVLEGVPLLGAAFSVGLTAAEEPARLVVFALASFFLLAHVFTLNDWADFTRGIHHSNRAMLQLESRKVPPSHLLFFSFLLLAGSAALFLALSERSFLLAAAIATLGICYSHPSLNAKSMPIVSTLLHFVGGTIHFLLGYGFLLPIDRRGVLIGVFFGLTFAAGHPLQEVRDLIGDRQVGAKTNAVVFGKVPSFFASVALFTAEYGYLFWLAWTKLIPRALAFVSIAAFVLHITWALLALRRGLTSEDVVQFERRYRVLYAIIGLAMLITIFA